MAVQGTRYIYELIQEFRAKSEYFRTHKHRPSNNISLTVTNSSLGTAVKGDDAEDYASLARVLEDPNTKRMLFDARQAAIFDDLSMPPDGIVSKVRLPFPQLYLEFTEPILLDNTEPGFEDYTRSFFVGESGMAWSNTPNGPMQGRLTQAVMFAKSIGDDGLAMYVDRSWQIDLQRGQAFSMIGILRQVMPDAYLPESWPDGGYMPAGWRITPEGKWYESTWEDMTWWERVITNDTALLMWCLTYMMAKSIVIVEESENRAQRRRIEREGKIPEPWHVVKVDPKIIINHMPHPENEGTGTGHSYRYDVIGHLRFGRHPRKDGTFSETVEWVPPHQRGLSNSVYIPKTYLVERGRKIADPVRRYFGGE